MLGTLPSRAARCALAAGALLLLAGCGGGDAVDASTDEKPPVIGDDTRWDADQRAVIDTVGAYRDWYHDALATAADPQLDMRALRSIVAEPYATELGQEVSVQQSNGLEMRGEDVYTPSRVTVDGHHATLVACWDSREGDRFMTYSKPAQKVNPAPPTRTTFTLVAAPKAETGWKISRRHGRGECDAAP